MASYFVILNNTIPTANLATIRASCFAEQALSTSNMKAMPETISRDAQTRLLRVDNPSNDWLAAQAWLADPQIAIFSGEETDGETQTVIGAWKAAQRG